MIKVTFTLDEDTVSFLGRTAEQLGIPKSQVVREAIRVYGTQAVHLSDAERERLLGVFDEVTSRIPERSRDEVLAELEAVRTARRDGGRGGAEP